MKDEYKERLAALSTTERTWLKHRLLTGSPKAAAKAAGIHPSTCYTWSRWEDIKALVNEMEADAVGSAYHLLQEIAPEAVRALREALKDKAHRVAAANSILDRAGLPKATEVDVTSGGQPLPVISEIVVNLPDESLEDD